MVTWSEFLVAMWSSKIYINPIDPRRRLTLVEQTQIVNEASAGLKNDKGIGNEIDDRKRPFVEPAISVPVDVLEATTFFQTATSGVTN